MTATKTTLAAMALVLTAFLLGAVFMRAAIASAPIHPIVVRWCPEDAVHVGWGDFDGTRWEHYRCIARDDLGGI